MSDRLRKKKAPAATQPALTQLLFAAMNEHEAALARVSRLLHDDVSQILSAVGLQLDAMRMDFREQAPGIDVRAGEIQTMLEQVIGHLRDISNQLNPSVVERAGLQFALEQLAEKSRSRGSVAIRVHCDPGVHVPINVAKTFYKIAEYALDTALSRPACSAINIQLKRSQGSFVLEVHDNGNIEPAGANGVPLQRLLMDYYATENHVVLEIKSSPQANVVRAGYPVAHDQELAS
jgi:signal transduction histidine kinase